MKKLLLFGFGVSLFGAVAQAQQISPLQSGAVVSLLPRRLAGAGLEPVAGKTGVFTLKTGNYAFRDLMDTLVAKSGGKAIFADELRSTSLLWRDTSPGTLPELIAKAAGSRVAVGHIGGDWVFVPTKTPRTAIDVSLLVSQFRAKSRARAPIDPEFNKNPHPGQNLPRDAKPFQFNRQRMYHVPIRS